MMGIRESRGDLARKEAKETKGNQAPQAPLALRGQLVSQDFQVEMDYQVCGASRACLVQKVMKDCVASRALEDQEDYRVCPAYQVKRVRVDMWA